MEQKKVHHIPQIRLDDAPVNDNEWRLILESLKMSVWRSCNDLTRVNTIFDPLPRHEWAVERILVAVVEHYLDSLKLLVKLDFTNFTYRTIREQFKGIDWDEETMTPYIAPVIFEGNRRILDKYHNVLSADEVVAFKKKVMKP